MLIQMRKTDVAEAVNRALDYWNWVYLNKSKATYIEVAKSNFKPKRRWLGLLPPNKFELTDAEAEAEWTETIEYAGIVLDSAEQRAINTRTRKIHKLIDLQVKILADSFSYVSLEDHDFELISGFLVKDGA